MKIVHLCSTQDDSGHGWKAKLIGEVPILGRVIERLGLFIRILSMANSGCVPDRCIKYCGESVPPLQSVKLLEVPRPRLWTVEVAILFRRQMFLK